MPVTPVGGSATDTAMLTYVLRPLPVIKELTYDTPGDTPASQTESP